MQVRNKVNDIRAELPQGVQGPFFNDQFGDVFGNIYAFTSDGLSLRQLRDYAERARTEILTVPNAGKVELLGTQDEVIYLDFSTQHVAGLGIDQQAVLQSLQAQNAVAPSGVVQAGPQRVSLRVSGQFTLGGEPAQPQPTRARPLLPAAPTSPPSRAATSTRRSRCSATTASRRSGSPSA